MSATYDTLAALIIVAGAAGAVAGRIAGLAETAVNCGARTALKFTRDDINAREIVTVPTSQSNYFNYGVTHMSGGAASVFPNYGGLAKWRLERFDKAIK